MRFLPSLFFFTALFAGFAAQAQWQWLDREGRTVFSDRPPPPDVPDRNIRRRPAGPQAPAQTVPLTSAAPLAPPAQTASQPSGTDRLLQERRRQTLEAEAAQRNAEEERLARQRADNCARARQFKAGLDSGQRVSRFNDKGEREILDDTARAVEAQRLQAVIDSDCR